MDISADLPNKSLFKINEVCNITGIKSYVLRFWESEFEEISPTMSPSGQKMYDHKNVEILLCIKKLLFEHKLSIEKAKFTIQKIFNSSENTDPDVSLLWQGENGVECTNKADQIKSQLLSDVCLNRTLSEDDVGKLGAVKSKLNNLLQQIETVQEANQWS